MKIPGLSFSVVLFTFQITLFILYGVLAEYEKYDPAENGISSYYPVFQDVHVMIFVGFAFLMTFLKKYGFSSAGYNMIIASVVIQWAMLVNAWVSNAADGKADPGKVKISIKNLITSDFSACTVLITFGAVLGKTSRLQLILIAIFEVVFAAANEVTLVHYLVVSDVGGSMILHVFGAYFGLAVAFVLRREETTEEENPKEGSTKTSDLFSLLATTFLWLLWPSFNAAMLGPGAQQHRAIINTYLGLAACTVAVFTISPLLNKKSKLNMVHIQNATLAGAVAIGSLANLHIKPVGAMVVGFLAGILSTIGYEFLTPILRKKLSIHDTCGVNNLHGMPGIMSGIAATIAAAIADSSDYGTDLYSIYPARAPLVIKGGKDRSKSTQAGMQFAALVVSLAISIVGGLITGVIVKCLDNPTKEQLFDDEDFWLIPEENEAVLNSHEVELTVKNSTNSANEA